MSTYKAGYIEGKVKMSVYVDPTIHKALKLAAVERGESMGEIAERALRKELGMVAKLTWQVIEDNGGGLHLAVMDGNNVIYYADGYEHNEDGLRADLDALRDGDDTSDWEMPVDDPQAAYDRLTGHETGWTVVADQDGVYYDRMGEAAKRVFGEEYAGYTISYTILGGNLFRESGDEGGTYDEIESARSYARMVRERLEAEYPGATIEIDLQERTSGAGGGVVVTTPDGGDYRPGDYGEGGRVADRVEDICDRVWQSWEWVVYREA